MALELWSFMARHMGAKKGPRKRRKYKRRIVSFFGRIYGNPFRNKPASIDIVQCNNNHCSHVAER
jgi:hypothetical protein